MTFAAVLAPVRRGKALILEDELKVAERLERELEEGGGVEVRVVTDMKGFAEIIEEEQFDVASIDWEVNEVYCGPEALEMIDRLQPETARIVHTKHMVEHEAHRYNPDSVLIKRATLENFGTTMRQGIKLGIARKIVKSLEEMGENDLPDLPAGQEELIDHETEHLICIKARRAVVQRKAAGAEDERLDSLLSHLLRRGWWEKFNPAAYVLLPREDKLMYLLQHAGCKPEDVAVILEVDPRTVMSQDHEERTTAAGEQSLLERKDELLSILAFVLRLSGYEPDLMAHYWQVKNMYHKSLSKPPWNDSGLGVYLKNNGRAGLIECLTWIRSN
jgi:hypothetical protein